MKKRTGILFVDDNRDICQLYQSLIEAEPDLFLVGYLLSVENLGEEVARLNPDLIILDLNMPGKEPLEALNEIKSLYPLVKVITFSGYADEQTRKSALQAGALLHLSKAQDIEQVLAAIRNCVK
jgi:DNA-binding NarL/FixJ family response regulator